MINKAIAHLTDQAIKENNPAITKIEEHLTNLCTTEEIAEKLLDKSKTLQELYCEITKYARKREFYSRTIGKIDAIIEKCHFFMSNFRLFTCVFLRLVV